jgi:hypothetical protein
MVEILILAAFAATLLRRTTFIVSIFSLKYSVLPSTSLHNLQNLQLIESFFLNSLMAKQILRGSLQKMESVQDELNVELFGHLFLALHFLPHFIPTLTQAAIGTRLVEDVAEVCKNVEAGEVRIFILFVLEGFLGNVEFESHK